MAMTADPARAAARIAFIQAHGWPAEAIAPLAADASTRAYYRLTDAGRRAVLMDAPTNTESAACPPDADAETRRALGYNALARLAGPDSRPFAAIASFLKGQGLGAPDILAADFDQGFLLLEDMGDALFARVAAQGTDVTPLYEAAIDTLVHLHRADVPDGLPAGNGDTVPVLSYDAVALNVELDLLPEWYLTALTGNPTAPDVAAAFRAAFAPLLARIQTGRPVLVLRDYHAENLLWRPAHDGLGRVGLLDFQDGLAGHPAYDLVSLLTDARRDVDPALAEAMRARYRAARAGDPGFDPDAFDAAYAILSVQRNTKILGIFARLWRRDGKPAYLAHIPRVWAHVEAGLADPALAPVRAWFDTHIPDAARGDALSTVRARETSAAAAAAG